MRWAYLLARRPELWDAAYRYNQETPLTVTYALHLYREPFITSTTQIKVLP